MPLEIERRYLVETEEWRAQCSRSVEITQGYFSPAADYCLRVRIMDEAKAFLTLKGSAKNLGSRPEFEYPVPLDHANEMLETFCGSRILRKRRHYLTMPDGHQWEIDEFLDRHSGLVIAEIELKYAEEPFLKPMWLGEDITRQPQYSNQNLANTCTPGRALKLRGVHSS